jgi:hypothetical protein
MIPPFDILRVDATGLRWVQASSTLEEAQARVAELMTSHPCEYLIISQQTGHKISIKPEEERH